MLCWSEDTARMRMILIVSSDETKQLTATPQRPIDRPFSFPPNLLGQLRQSRSKTFIHSSTPSSSTVTTRHAAALHSSSGSPSSAVVSATKSKINGNSEMKHSTAAIAIAPNNHSSIAPYSAPKLLDSTPTLELYLHSTAPSYHDHSPLP
jgi:hypothetical protein